MKCTIPEISWHNREPVLSVDIYPIFDEFYRLASGGGDSHVLIWQLTIADNGAVKQELTSDLTRHQKAVNCVRWSPSGQYLASADDDANIIIWQQKTDNIPSLEGETSDKETWTHFKVLRGHKEDIYDLCWSVDSRKLFSGSIDNTAILWDIQKGKLDNILTDHKGFVQGVSWDPKNQVIATISTDRICRIFDTSGKHVKARISKGSVPVPPDHFLYEKEVKYFHDDTFKSFFRRLQFSPDGNLLIVPSGYMEADNCKKTLNATLVFSLGNIRRPATILPLSRQNSTVVRCCPILFELKENGPDPVIKLPYRMVIAVGTDHDIILYDTQQTAPFARFQDMHYTRLTDLTWSNDGLILIASSTDGFCSLITFDMNEIGVPYTKEESECEENVLEMSTCEEVEKSEKDENVDITNKDVKEKEESKKRPSFLQQWATKQAAKKAKIGETVVMKKGPNGVIEIVDDEDVEVDDIKEETSKKNINKHSDAKPIAVRRKPTKNTEEDKTKETVKNDNDAKPIAVRRKPSKNSEEDKTKETVKNDNDAKPIAVRKNPTKNSEEDKTKETVKNDNDAKPIAVRRKPSKNSEEDKTKETVKNDNDAKPIALRKNPTKNSEEDKTKETVKNDNDAKPIAVRRKPTKNSEEDKIKETVKNDINAKPIAVKRTSADAVLIEFAQNEVYKRFGKPKTDTNYSKPSDAQPITIRRSPPKKCSEAERLFIEMLQNDANKRSGVKPPIAVRRKPMENPEITVKDDKERAGNSVQSVIDSKESGGKEDKKEVNGEENNEKTVNKNVNNTQKAIKRIAPIKIGDANPDKYKVRPIEVRRQPRNELENCKTKEAEKIIVNNIETVNKCSVEFGKKTEESQLSSVELKKDITAVETVEDVGNIKKENGTQIKNSDSLMKVSPKSKKPVKRKLSTDDCSPKINVSGLVRKKSKGADGQQNLLLAFLQKPSESSPSEKNKKGQKTKVVEKKSKKQLILDLVDLTGEENAVSDPLSMEKNSQAQLVSSRQVQNYDEDCTEDFTLQLEEETMEGEQKVEKVDEENAEKSPESANEKPQAESSEKKTPRKVPFITLASPKRALPKK